MSKRDARDLAIALLLKARGDEAGLRAVVDEPDVPDHVVGFLAQQAIEKAMKAVLVVVQISFQRSHDIDYLSRLLEGADLVLPKELRAAVALTPWAVEFRYADDFKAAALDRTETLATVAALTSWATEAIGT